MIRRPPRSTLALTLSLHDALPIAWTPVQIAAVEGHPNYGNAIIFDTVYWETLANPTTGCGAGVSAAETYNPETNPEGVRCTLADYMINVFGPRPQALWSPVEKKIGHGFAGLPIDNGVVEHEIGRAHV